VLLPLLVVRPRWQQISRHSCSSAALIPVAPPYPYAWSGFYIGGNLGAGWNNAGSATDAFSNTFGTTTNTSFLGGGQVGVNYEFRSFFVIGAVRLTSQYPT